MAQREGTITNCLEASSAILLEESGKALTIGEDIVADVLPRLRGVQHALERGDINLALTLLNETFPFGNSLP